MKNRSKEEKTWQNEPNEQIAGWRSVVDDTQGLSKPHDMFSMDRGRDNALTIAQNKEKPKLHESAEINEMANKLYSKYKAISESEDICHKCGFTPCECTKKDKPGKDSPFSKVKVDENKKETKEVVKEEMENVEKECESCGADITSGKLCADCRREEKNTRKSPKFKKNG